MLNLSAENATFTAENRGPYVCVSVLVNCTNEDLSATTAQLWQCCSCLKQLKLSPRTHVCVSVLVNCTNEDLSATTAQLWQCCSCLKQLKLSPRTLSTIKAQNMKNMRD